jgi:hypothetical protein
MYNDLGSDAGIVIETRGKGRLDIAMDDGEGSGFSRVWVEKQTVKERSEEKFYV